MTISISSPSSFSQVDHFEGIHAMPDEVEKVDGAPNFRQVSFNFAFCPRISQSPVKLSPSKVQTFGFFAQVNGYPVFGTAQPTEEGFRSTVSHKHKFYRIFLKRQFLGKCWTKWKRGQRQNLLRLSGSTCGRSDGMMV